MSVYRIHFRWKEKEYSLKAASLDMTHPYFVAIKDLQLPSGRVVINPAEDEIRKSFGGARQLMIPFSNISLIEEYHEDPDSGLVAKKPAVRVPVETFGKVIIPEKFRKKE